MSARLSAQKGRVALVTGAARGIGEGVARLFLEEGFSVALADADAARGRRTLRALAPLGDASFVAMDVSREADVRRRGPPSSPGRTSSSTAASPAR